MKKVYHYDRLTGALLSEAEADESPMEPGVFLCPAFATFVAPPAYGEGELPYMLQGKWQVVAVTPEEATGIVLGIVTTAEQKAEMVEALIAREIDAAAKGLGFANIVDATTYPNSVPSQKQYDAEALRAWRVEMDHVASKIIIALTAAPNSPMPTVDQVIALLPRFTRKIYSPPMQQEVA